ncbi:hypothetical protein [Azospirillum canadense]|uniref:hypothetical protein n=1 Tax=Azospirillum canadense TaxID=403962 RepID=UPI0022278385|nr:hypothetical protein [Azospirillum canadense]MCW2239084.1 hypothetical protein [Azospirillum canadense]
MAELTVPVLRLSTVDDCARAMDVLIEQQFAVRREADTEISVSPWEDLEEAQCLLKAEGIACERGEKPVRRLGPRMQFPQA